MSNSSQQDHYSITLDNDKLSVGTIAIDINSANSDPYVYNYQSMAGGVGNSGIDTITIAGSSNAITSYNTQYELDFGKEWATNFPEFYKLEAMCREYPALKKAFENFKTIYEMIKDDYDSKTRDEAQ